MSPLRKWHERADKDVVQMWIVRGLIFMSIFSILILGCEQRKTNAELEQQNVQLEQQTEDIRNLAIETKETFENQTLKNCSENRRLITDIVLRNLGSNLEKYKENPEKVLRVYRAILVNNNTLSDEAIDEAIQRTRFILERSDPETCMI